MAKVAARLLGRAITQTAREAVRQPENQPPCPQCGHRDSFAAGGIAQCDKHGVYTYEGQSGNDIMEQAREASQELTCRGGEVELPSGFNFWNFLKK